MPAKGQTIRRRSQFILSGIVSLHIYWKVEQTCSIYFTPPQIELFQTSETAA